MWYAPRRKNNWTTNSRDLKIIDWRTIGYPGWRHRRSQPGRWADRSITIFTIFTVSFPSFVTAIFLIILLASWLRWLPASSLIPPDANLWESARYLMLPVLTLVLGLLAQITLHTRNSLIEVLRSDYLRTAVSKGMPKRVESSATRCATHCCRRSASWRSTWVGCSAARCSV